jgi:hypothetical protein
VAIANKKDIEDRWMRGEKNKTIQELVLEREKYERGGNWGGRRVFLL